MKARAWRKNKRNFPKGNSCFIRFSAGHAVGPHIFTQSLSPYIYSSNSC